MTQKDAQLLEPGVYRLFWKRGGDALAVVGRGIGADKTTWYVAVGHQAHRGVNPYVSSMTLYLAGSVRWALVAWADPVICVDAPP